MITKDKLRQSIENLPDSFTIDELIDQLIFIEKVEEGLKQSEEGKVISNDDVKEIIEKWSK
jgi:predicted transcriptional regulator